MPVSSIGGTAFRLMDADLIRAGTDQTHIHQAERPAQGNLADAMAHAADYRRLRLRTATADCGRRERGGSGRCRDSLRTGGSMVLGRGGAQIVTGLI
jgi:hypothetical protein